MLNVFARSIGVTVGASMFANGNHVKIGIIGAGNIGSTLARKLASSGHQIKLANSKGADTIRDLAREIGVTPVAKEDTTKDVAVVILAIPFAKYPDLVTLFDIAASDIVVIDTSNYYPLRDDTIVAVDAGKPESVWVSEQIGRPVVKSWNALLATTLAERGLPAEATGRIAIPVARDGARAKAVAMELVEDTGFDALDSGSLGDSWRQQPGTPAYCTELTKEALQLALGAADRYRAADNRDSLLKNFMAAGGSLSHDEIVARNRTVTA